MDKKNFITTWLSKISEEQAIAKRKRVAKMKEQYRKTRERIFNEIKETGK